MKKIIFAIFLILALASAVSAYDMDDTVIDGLNVTTDVDAVLDEKSDKNIMLIFDSETCVYCDLLKENVLSNPDVQKKLNEEYIVVLVDNNKRPDIAGKYKAIGTPITVVLNPEGKEICRIEGYVESNEFLEDLKEI